MSACWRSPSPLPGLHVQCRVKAGDFLVGQEPGVSGPPVGLDADGRVGVDMAALVAVDDLGLGEARCEVSLDPADEVPAALGGFGEGLSTISRHASKARAS